MTRIAHLTDVHFGAEDPAAVAALAAELRADRPDLVVVSGDLTQRARIGEFMAARQFLDGIGAPWLAVPGNHDIPRYDLVERFLDPYARWRRLVAPQTEPAWQDAGCAVIGLDTAQRMGWHWDWSRGRVSGRRLRRLVARLGAVPAGRVRVVAMHHPLLLTPGMAGEVVVGNADRALAAFAQAGVGLVLSGHLHRRHSRALGSPGGGTLLLQGASATSWRLRGEPNAYNRIVIGPDGGTAVEPRIWDGQGWASPDQANAPAGAADSPRLRPMASEASAASRHSAPAAKNAGR